jgi:hypothetical protein
MKTKWKVLSAWNKMAVVARPLDTHCSVPSFREFLNKPRIFLCYAVVTVIHVACYALQLFNQEMEKRSAHAADPKQHEQYVSFKKSTDELLMGGKDRIPAFLVICLVFILSHYTASTS